MTQAYQLRPIGWIRKSDHEVCIELDPALRAGLLGLEEFSHVVVCYWFHENDTAQNRSRLQVHPRKNPANPLTGVFATHAPV
ncbi:MAG TPA: TrmO family methyltransferase, partial [Desulfosarcina sp.]|nr:TrmO family methyltransferase [Desulfosarcina sp.]